MKPIKLVTLTISLLFLACNSALPLNAFCIYLAPDSIGLKKDSTATLAQKTITNRIVQSNVIKEQIDTLFYCAQLDTLVLDHFFWKLGCYNDWIIPDIEYITGINSLCSKGFGGYGSYKSDTLFLSDIKKWDSCLNCREIQLNTLSKIYPGYTSLRRASGHTDGGRMLVFKRPKKTEP